MDSGRIAGLSVSMLALSLTRPLSVTLTELNDGDRCTVEPCIAHVGYDVSRLLPCSSEFCLLWALQMVSTLTTLVLVPKCLGQFTLAFGLWWFVQKSLVEEVSDCLADPKMFSPCNESFPIMPRRFGTWLRLGDVGLGRGSLPLISALITA